MSDETFQRPLVEFRALAQSMVTHEQALYDFTQLELSQGNENSLTAIIEQLEHKLPS